MPAAQPKKPPSEGGRRARPAIELLLRCCVCSVCSSSSPSSQTGPCRRTHADGPAALSSRPGPPLWAHGGPVRRRDGVHPRDRRRRRAVRARRRLLLDRRTGVGRQRRRPAHRARLPPAGAGGLSPAQLRPDGARVRRPRVRHHPVADARRRRARPPARARPDHRPPLPGHRARPGQPRRRPRRGAGRDRGGAAPDARAAGSTRSRRSSCPTRSPRRSRAGRAG